MRLGSKFLRPKHTFRLIANRSVLNKGPSGKAYDFPLVSIYRSQLTKCGELTIVFTVLNPDVLCYILPKYLFFYLLVTLCSGLSVNIQYKII